MVHEGGLGENRQPLPGCRKTHDITETGVNHLRLQMQQNTRHKSNSRTDVRTTFVHTKCAALDTGCAHFGLGSCARCVHFLHVAHRPISHCSPFALFRRMALECAKYRYNASS